MDQEQLDRLKHLDSLRRKLTPEEAVELYRLYELRDNVDKLSSEEPETGSADDEGEEIEVVSIHGDETEVEDIAGYVKTLHIDADNSSPDAAEHTSARDANAELTGCNSSNSAEYPENYATQQMTPPVGEMAEIASSDRMAVDDSHTTCWDADVQQNPMICGSTRPNSPADSDGDDGDVAAKYKYIYDDNIVIYVAPSLML